VKIAYTELSRIEVREGHLLIEEEGDEFILSLWA
jgi:hypothetical protein